MVTLAFEDCLVFSLGLIVQALALAVQCLFGTSLANQANHFQPVSHGSLIDTDRYTCNPRYPAYVLLEMIIGRLFVQMTIQNSPNIQSPTPMAQPSI